MKRLFVVLAAMAIASSAFAAPLPAGKAQTAVFAGGNFWSLQAAFDDVYGVTLAVEGYTGGKTRNPNAGNYAQNGFVEAVQVTWDPARASYADLLNAYWRHIDPTDAGGQFADRGPQFRTIIYYMDDTQKTAAEASRAALPRQAKLPGPVVTEIARAAAFYPADAKLQEYARFNPDYKAWFDKSGRTQFFSKVWGASYMVDPGAPPAAKGGSWTKPSRAQLQQTLNAAQFDITQNDGTDPPFNNQYDDFWQAGIYVDIVSGEPLFSSTDKFDSQSGWPSFTRPMVPSNIVFVTDNSLGMSRTEVRSKYANSHLGHVFDDGPPPTNLRYCMDSSALRFIPVADMQKEGYGQYLKLFSGKMGL